jgi:hypothetical protein
MALVLRIAFVSLDGVPLGLFRNGTGGASHGGGSLRSWCVRYCCGGDYLVVCAGVNRTAGVGRIVRVLIDAVVRAHIVDDARLARCPSASASTGDYTNSIALLHGGFVRFIGLFHNSNTGSIFRPRSRRTLMSSQ